MTQREIRRLDELMDGALTERFNYEMERVLQNVFDPVELTPLRTFHEVEQPSNPFVLRFSENAQAALFEGDGGAWMLTAVENIRAWLADALTGYNVEVIA
jgi:hypothetical protein